MPLLKAALSGIQSICQQWEIDAEPVMICAKSFWQREYRGVVTPSA
jgi:hypothetical protein